jgi:hypothetical protein
MNTPTHLTLALIVSFGLAGSTLAQDKSPGDAAQSATTKREAEIKELQAMLARIDAALTALDPVVNPTMTFAQYDVRHVFYEPTNRTAPSLTIPADNSGFRSGAGGGGFSFEEDEWGGGTLFDTDQLETLLMDTVGEDHWDEPASIEFHDGYLLVTQTEVAQSKIRRLLQGLKSDQTRSIQLEVGFYALPSDLQQEIQTAALGAEGSLSPKVLDRLDRAVKAGRATLSGSAMLIALNGQQVYLHQGGEQAFVGGFDRAAGGTGSLVQVVTDPLVEVLRTGLALDLRATLSGEGPRPRVSMEVSFVRTRPFEISRRKTPWGPIDMPRVAVDSVRTSARVPSGGGMLVFSARASSDETQPDVTIIVRPLVTSQGK